MWKVTCKTFTILLLWFLLTNNTTNTERILVLTPTALYSHQSVFQALCLALSKRGHELIVITPPIKNSTLKNYTEIEVDTSLLTKKYNSLVSRMSAIELLKFGLKASHEVSDIIFKNPKVKELYRHNSNEKFDAVIIEPIGFLSVSALAYRFNAPLIGKMIFISNIIYKLSCIY